MGAEHLQKLFTLLSANTLTAKVKNAFASLNNSFAPAVA